MATEILRFQFRRGTAAQWADANPVLANGEPGIETDTKRQKLGDGVTAWASLPYSNVSTAEVQQAIEAGSAAGSSAFNAGQSAASALGHRNAAEGFKNDAAARVAEAAAIRDGIPTTNDAIVKGLLDTPGSQTAGALNATILDRANRRVDTEASDSFTGKPDGYPVLADSGQAYSLYPTSGDRKPIIKNGKLTFNVDNPGAGGGSGGYASLPTTRPVTSADTTFTFTPYTDNGGLACLAAMESDIGASNASGGGVPRSPAHLIVAPDYWSFGVFPVAGQPIVSLKSHTYSTPLTADGVKTYRMSFAIDRASGTAYVSVPYPDGTQRQFSFQHEAIKIAAYSAFIEPWQGTDTTKDYALAGFTDFNVGTGNNRAAVEAEKRISSTVRTQEQEIVKVQTLSANQTLTTGFVSTGVSISGNWGKTGRCLFEVQVPLEIRGNADVYLIMHSGTGSVGSTSTRAWKGHPNIIDAADVDRRHIIVMMDATGNTADPVTAAGLPFTYTLQALAFNVTTVESPPGPRAVILSGAGHNVIIKATPY